MSREKQPYLVNPPLALNPFELLRVPARKLVAHTDSKGRFTKVGDITKKRHHKAKKISRKTAAGLFKKAAKLKKAEVKHIFKRHHKAAKRVVKHAKKIVRRHTAKKVVRHTKRHLTASHKRAMQRGRLAPSTRFMYDELRKRAGLINPIMLVNSKRRKSMKRRNPIMKMLSGSEMKGVGQLALDGAVIVAGVTIGKLAIDKLAAQFPTLSSPIAKLGSHAVLATLVYVAGSRVKKIPARVVNMLAIGVLLPAVTDVVDMVKARISAPSVTAIGAYVPAQKLGAYVPQHGLGLGADYGDKY